MVPEICDYELRRSLIRLNSLESLKKLDELATALGYIPITTPAMRKAAELWAQMRTDGNPLAHDDALDGDVVLAAQVLVEQDTLGELIVATTNAKHLDQLVNAKFWRDIK